MPHNLDQIMAMTSQSKNKRFDLQHFFKEKQLVQVQTRIARGKNCYMLLLYIALQGGQEE